MHDRYHKRYDSSYKENVKSIIWKDSVKNTHILEKKNINLIHGITRFKVLKQLPDYLHWLYFGWKNRKVIKNNLNNQ